MHNRADDGTEKDFAQEQIYSAKNYQNCLTDNIPFFHYGSGAFNYFNFVIPQFPVGVFPSLQFYNPCMGLRTALILPQYQNVPTRKEGQNMIQAGKSSTPESNHKKLWASKRLRLYPQQAIALEKAFKCYKYPSMEQKYALAQSMHLPFTKVTVWFQNRRVKERKQSNKRENVLRKTPTAPGENISHSMQLEDNENEDALEDSEITLEDSECKDTVEKLVGRLKPSTKNLNCINFEDY